MIILPAIDIIDGKPVRLYQGNYDMKESVAESVKDTAMSFFEAGSEYIHIVDLDGAKSGNRDNEKVILETVNSISTPIELGGGIRKMEDIDFYIQHGISRIILGTAAINNESLLKEAIDKYGEKIAVGMDCKNGYAMAEGWLQGSDLYYIDFARHLEEIGVKNIIFTDILKDGTLSGPNVEMLENLKNAVDIDITASGGIRDITNIETLTKLNLYGTIIGKAIYSGTIDLKEAIKKGKEI